MKRNERLPSLGDDAGDARPLWGYPLRMLTHGYDWKGAAGYTPENWKPRKVWVTEYVERVCYVEPDTRVSNKSTTGKIVHYMVRSGWSAEQVHHELQLSENVGGLYYRWRCNTDKDGGEAFLTAMIAGTYSAEAVDTWRDEQYSRGVSAGVDERFLPKPKNRTRKHTQHDNTDSVLSGKPGQCWKTVGTTQILKKSAEELLRHLQIVGPQSMSECKRSAPMRGNYVQAYVDALAEAGLITTVLEPWRTPDGKTRRCRVIRVAPPEVAEARLRASALPEGDLDLWRVLKSADMPQEPFEVITLTDVLNAPGSTGERLTFADLMQFAQQQSTDDIAVDAPWLSALV